MTVLVPSSPPAIEGQGDIQPRRLCGSCQSDLDDTVPEWARQCKSCFGDSTTKRDCRICVRARIPMFEPEWRTVCSSCYKDSEKRQCRSCEECVIPDYEPDWRKICTNCYKDKSKYSRCNTCKEHTIKPGTPSYVRQCGTCWLNKRSKSYKVCPLCDDPRLTCLKSKKMCIDCKKLGKTTR
jgi:hypothetical protein